jgi:hypothetical protein
MLTRHKDVVLVEPFNHNEDLAFTTNLDCFSLQSTRKKKQMPPVPAAPVAAVRKPLKRKAVEDVKKSHLNVENKPQATNTTQAVALESPSKRLKATTTDTQAPAPQAPPPQAPAPIEISASLDALAAPIADLHTLLNSLEAASISSTTEEKDSAKTKLLQARATAQRLSRLAAEKRNSTKDGHETHVSSMFEMHGGIALLEAAITMEVEYIRNKTNTPAGSSTADTATAIAAASVYDQAAAVLETCAARSTTAHGPELTVSIIQTFTQRAAALARLRGHILKLQYQASSRCAGVGGGAGRDSWKGQKFTSKAMETTTATIDNSTVFLEAFQTIQLTTNKLDVIQQLADNEGNEAAVRAVAALRFMAGEVFMSSQPVKLWALIDACKASIMKI